MRRRRRRTPGQEEVGKEEKGHSSTSCLVNETNLIYRFLFPFFQSVEEEEEEEEEEEQQVPAVAPASGQSLSRNSFGLTGM